MWRLFLLQSWLLKVCAALLRVHNFPYYLPKLVELSDETLIKYCPEWILLLALAQFHRLCLHKGFYHWSTQFESHIVLFCYNAFLRSAGICTTASVFFPLFCRFIGTGMQLPMEQTEIGLNPHKNLSVVRSCFPPHQVAVQNKNYLRLPSRGENRLVNLSVKIPQQ